MHENFALYLILLLWSSYIIQIFQNLLNFKYTSNLLYEPLENFIYAQKNCSTFQSPFTLYLKFFVWWNFFPSVFVSTTLLHFNYIHIYKRSYFIHILLYLFRCFVPFFYIFPLFYSCFILIKVEEKSSVCKIFLLTRIMLKKTFLDVTWHKNIQKKNSINIWKLSNIIS